MTNQNYNGWTNYATWRVNLEIFDGLDPQDMGWDRLDKYELIQAIKEHVEEILFEQSDKDSHLAFSYAMAFVSDVNWHEIAKHMRENYDLTDEEEAA
jgi:hypothetical protein